MRHAGFEALRAIEPAVSKFIIQLQLTKYQKSNYQLTKYHKISTQQPVIYLILDDIDCKLYNVLPHSNHFHAYQYGTNHITNKLDGE